MNPIYPLGRILVETQRPDAWTIGGIPTAQLIGAVSIILCAALLIWRHRGQTKRVGHVRLGRRKETRA
jgi:prolipoprotein diacylglyceryltransferase